MTNLSSGYHLLKLVFIIVCIFIVIEIVRRLRHDYVSKKKQQSIRKQSYNLTIDLAVDPSESLVVSNQLDERGDISTGGDGDESTQTKPTTTTNTWKLEGNSKRIRKNFMKRFKEFKIGKSPKRNSPVNKNNNNNNNKKETKLSPQLSQDGYHTFNTTAPTTATATTTGYQPVSQPVSYEEEGMKANNKDENKDNGQGDMV
jgi:hypothetical protein